MSESRARRQTYIILSIIIVLSVLVFAFAYIEVNSSRDDLLTSKRNEAVTLMESLVHGTEASIAANNLLEDLIVSHLRTSAQFLRHRVRSGDYNRQFLEHIARRIDISLLAVTNEQDEIHVANLPIIRANPETRNAMDSVMSGAYQWYIVPDFGVEDSTGRVSTFYALIMAQADKRGVVIAGISSAVLLDYRRRTGLGTMFQDIGKNEDILYVLIQDEQGILSASRGISSMSSIGSDMFLATAFSTDSTFTRIVENDDGVKLMEAVRRVDSESGYYYLARIGLSLANVRAIQQRSMRRVILIGIAMVALGGLVLGFLFTRRRFSSLQQEHERVKTSTDLIMENIADGVIAIDPSGTVSFRNATARGLIPADVNPVGKDDPLFLLETLRTAQPVMYRESALSADGKDRILGVSTSIIYDPENNPESVIAIFRDLTEEKRTQEQLRRRERLTALGELAGGVAHEIRNPLNAIGIIAQRLRSEFNPQSDADEYTQLTSTVRSEVERVNTIIKQFLDFARPPKLQLERIWLHVVVAQTLEVISSQAKAANVRVSLSVEDHMYIDADRNVLKQAIMNLCQNALDAMPQGGHLDLTVQRQDGQAMLLIQDTGEGIPKEVQAKMFNLYYSTKSTGTGLGLSIVHQIISEHGGEISVESSPQHGATFVIRLPIASNDQRI